MRKKDFMSKKFPIFSVYGIEAEYMIVDKDTLMVNPIADKIIKELNHGKIVNEVELGKVSWSNELVNHVLEIKSTDPETDLENLELEFSKSIQHINSLLEKYNAVLMPTAMHPWFDPDKETMLWPHGQREIYKLYDEIFNCKGHGWSNLQSVHINFPYSSEAEFRVLHSSIRCVLPMIASLAASSPYFAGQKGNFACNRLAFYEKNQAKIPSIIGNIIPEVFKTTGEYKEMLKTVYADISKYDNAKTLQHPWLNSRAAIPKFDVGAVEIRLMDIQESPYMDFTLIHLIIAIVKETAAKSIDSIEHFSDHALRLIYDETKKFSPQVDNSDYFAFFGIENCHEFHEFKVKLIDSYIPKLPERYKKGLEMLKQQGNLATRLSKSDLSKETYRSLIKVLGNNTIYE